VLFQFGPREDGEEQVDRREDQQQDNAGGELPIWLRPAVRWDMTASDGGFMTIYYVT
jgi:hypothetical protein